MYKQRPLQLHLYTCMFGLIYLEMHDNDAWDTAYMFLAPVWEYAHWSYNWTRIFKNADGFLRLAILVTWSISLRVLKSQTWIKMGTYQTEEWYVD